MRCRIDNPQFKTKFFSKLIRGTLIPKILIFSETVRNAFKTLIIENLEIFKRTRALISEKFITNLLRWPKQGRQRKENFKIY